MCVCVFMYVCEHACVQVYRLMYTPTHNMKNCARDFINNSYQTRQNAS